MLKIYELQKSEFSQLKKMKNNTSELARRTGLNQRTIHRYLKKDFDDVPAGFIARLEEVGVIRPMSLLREKIEERKKQKEMGF